MCSAPVNVQVEVARLETNKVPLLTAECLRASDLSSKFDVLLSTSAKTVDTLASCSTTAGTEQSPCCARTRAGSISTEWEDDVDDEYRIFSFDEELDGESPLIDDKSCRELSDLFFVDA
mmetsp:Transcript_24410/g.64207  ORF Transcript_24410/g.64207 Transcript_24410/m.64207 type:complete len:119 (-) Transcript_24410:266-622(-)